MNDYEIKQPSASDHPVYQLNNGAIDPIMTTMPGWIIRWGTVVLCGLFATFLVIAGLIHFPDVINVPICVLGPDPSGREGFVAEGRVPATLADRISRKETVVISLAAYPPEEFGTLSGTIQRIVPSTADSASIVHIVLSREKSMNKAHWRIPTGEGNAQVVINDRTLLDRFFDRLIR